MILENDGSLVSEKGNWRTHRTYVMDFDSEMRQPFEDNRFYPMKNMATLTIYLHMSTNSAIIDG